MTTTADTYRGALAAVDRLINRGGDADDVLRGVVRALSALYSYVAIEFADGALGPSLGTEVERASRYPIAFKGVKVAELVAASMHPDEDGRFLERVATLISPYCVRVT